MEVRQPLNGTDIYIRFNFKNGSADANFNPYPMFGQPDGNYDISISDFNQALEVRLQRISMVPTHT